MENPIKMDDLGVPLFLETPIYSSPRGSVRDRHWLAVQCRAGRRTSPMKGVKHLSWHPLAVFHTWRAYARSSHGRPVVSSVVFCGCEKITSINRSWSSMMMMMTSFILAHDRHLNKGCGLVLGILFFFGIFVFFWLEVALGLSILWFASGWVCVCRPKTHSIEHPVHLYCHNSENSKTSDLGSTSKPYIARGFHSFEKYLLSTWESSHSFGVSEKNLRK